jgi:ParB family chromosome partitioning protein
MFVKPSKKQIVIRPVERLKPHPFQNQFFTDPTEAELAKLMESMARDGQLTPIEITPDNEVICGRRRLLAAQKLEWTELECWIRTDLVEHGEDAIKRRLIEDNITRQQLGKLALARSYKALKELESAANEPGDVRDLIGRQLGVSGRQLDRYLRLLELPLVFQELVDQKRITLGQTASLLSLPKQKLTQLAKRVVGADDPRKLVIEALAAASKVSGTTSTDGNPSRERRLEAVWRAVVRMEIENFETLSDRECELADNILLTMGKLTGAIQ